ncbi:hypothetical protein RDI58_024089 [Solanum bulbocastanum]|uniref:Uncharacterized protein n=1 Tax=Solanum bulbocastanum TaxID=147425 RepID=A0AAN8Y351_SOLBU
MTTEVASNIHHINATTMDVDILLNTIKEEHPNTTHRKNGSPPYATTESTRPTAYRHDSINASRAYSDLMVGIGAARKATLLPSNDNRTTCDLNPPRLGIPCPDHQ